MSALSDLPLVSIVTPTFQRADYLETTIRSVLSQDYPNIEYHIMDGGSTDGSVEIIRRHAGRLASWTSGPDKGQAAAIRSGLERSTGRILAYLNSDDVYLPGAVRRVVEAFRRTGADLVFGDVRLVDERGVRIRDLKFTEFDFDTLLYEGGNLNQAGAFWTREIYDRVGGIDPAYQYGMDTDFFCRAAQVGRFAHERSFVADFRIHGGSKSVKDWDGYFAEWDRIRARYVDPATPSWRLAILKRRHQIRRAVRHVRQGDISYVATGIVKRLKPRSARPDLRDPRLL